MGEFPKFDETIAQNMRKASKACYENGNGLLEEANILYERARYARATSLAILAEEEFSKAMILHILSIKGRWDKEIFDGLKNHEKKQALSASMNSLMLDFFRHLHREKLSLIPYKFDIDGQVEDKFQSAKKEYIEKQLKDRRKQFAQFVSIGRTGCPCRTPSIFTKDDAGADIDNAVRFRAYLEGLYGIRKDDDPFYRGCTSIGYDQTITTLYHHSGITIHMKPFAWAENGSHKDEVTMNPFHVLNNFESFNPEQLDEKQKGDLAKIYKAYDFQGQIRSEMQRLGLRGTDYLDEVERLINEYAE